MAAGSGKAGELVLVPSRVHPGEFYARLACSTLSAVASPRSLREPSQTIWTFFILLDLMGRFPGPSSIDFHRRSARTLTGPFQAATCRSPTSPASNARLAEHLAGFMRPARFA